MTAFAATQALRAGEWQREPAPAKINLFLHVVGRRADGFHLLESLVAFADAGDTVTVSPASALTLSVGGRFADALVAESDNLVLRAARALANTVGRDPSVAIQLEKELPVASGIGGGSADAAATLRALARLWAIDLHQLDMAALASSLGADVPVCLTGSPALVGGIGEQVVRLPPLPRTAAVLVNPGRPLATPSVFKTFKGAGRPFSALGALDRARWSALSGPRALADALATTTNDLAPDAAALEPLIGDVLMALETRPGRLIARMSGSGATCFALFADAQAARAAARDLAARQPQWWVVDTVVGG